MLLCLLKIINVNNSPKPDPKISPCSSFDFKSHLKSPSCIANIHIGASKFIKEIIVSYVPNSSVVK